LSKTIFLNGLARRLPGFNEKWRDKPEQAHFKEEVGTGTSRAVKIL
jgi:hypothetical protein